jgi:hypothetical protein
MVMVKTEIVRNIWIVHNILLFNTILYELLFYNTFVVKILNILKVLWWYWYSFFNLYSSACKDKIMF